MPTMTKQAPLARGVPFLGSIPELAIRGFVPMLSDFWRDNGDFFRMRMGPRNVFAFTHPDAMKRVFKDHRENYVKGEAYDGFRLIVGDGMITMEGDAWAHRRRAAAPAFHRPSIESLTPIFIERSEELVRRLRDRSDRDEPFDALAEMTRLTMDIAGRALFAMPLDDSESAVALTRALEVANARGNTALALPLEVPTPSNLQMRRALATLDEKMLEIVDHVRQKANSSGKSVLEALSRFVDPETGERLDRRALRNEVVTFFIAGHETTALSLSWTLSLLADEPEAVERIAGEIEGVFGGGPLHYEGLERLPFTRAVIDESMRLRPAVWCFARNTVEDDEICGYEVKAGSMIMPLPIFTHRHPEFWDSPLAFRPERFLDGETSGRHPYAYVPFATGPRACLGLHFAIIEMLAGLTAIVRAMKFSRADGERIGLDGQVTLRPLGAIRLRPTFR